MKDPGSNFNQDSLAGKHTGFSERNGGGPSTQPRLDEGYLLDGLEIGMLEAAQEIEQAAAVLARGMLDNPLQVAAFGADPEYRLRKLYRLFVAVLSATDLPMLAARHGDGTIVGVLGMAPPGSSCQSSAAQQLRTLVPHLLPNVSSAILEMACCTGGSPCASEEQRHWHLGPMAVDAGLQRMGIGSLLMRVFCAQVDAAREEAYLQTDRPTSVRFYERFGFEVIGEQEVLGTHIWFMRRPTRNGR